MLDDVWTGALEEEGGAREVVVLSVVVVVSAGGLWGCEDGVVSPELDGLASMSLERGMRKKKRGLTIRSWRLLTGGSARAR